MAILYTRALIFTEQVFIFFTHDKCQIVLNGLKRKSQYMKKLVKVTIILDNSLPLYNHVSPG